MLYRTIKPLLVDAIQVNENLDVPTESGLVRVKPGDWLLRDTNGNLSRCDDISFKSTYECLSTSRSLEELYEGKSYGC
jgi:hypothetical protein